VRVWGRGAPWLQNPSIDSVITSQHEVNHLTSSCFSFYERRSRGWRSSVINWRQREHPNRVSHRGRQTKEHGACSFRRYATGVSLITLLAHSLRVVTCLNLLICLPLQGASQTDDWCWRRHRSEHFLCYNLHQKLILGAINWHLQSQSLIDKIYYMIFHTKYEVIFFCAH
jgi:hypothetical protein